MVHRDDHWYIERILAGDPGYYSCLVDRYKDMVYTIVFRIVKNHEDAEEVAQDVFVKAYQSMDSYQYKSKFSTWLYSIAYNTSISRIRRPKLQQQSIDELEYQEHQFANTMNGFEQLVLEEKRSILNQVLAEIDEEAGFLITLYYYDDKKPEEIAAITGLSKNLLKVKLYRARQRILSLLHRHLQKEIIYMI
jgi:RNA polymerase sigma factor (sigma-70 family)